MVILLAFIIVPIVEIAILIHVGGLIGGWETVGLVILTAAVGTFLFRTQGFRVLTRAEETLSKGIFPADALFDGICILIAGILLLTPGFVTDAVGLALLVPGLRALIGKAVWRGLLRSGHWQMSGHFTDFGGTSHKPGHAPGDDVIEGEFREVPPEYKNIGNSTRDKGGSD